ncbi:FliH/SctL family protein [Xanthomonas dyei]|uniref:Flagellar assembly protein FliH/Type III secretion system HrpE domain-containing protein n=2 Tax=Xanthomonas dyei TaxID=743699 RepID=A0A2S7BG14_9XANT|nr:FliH/SctL family protein [Xanthomonas dyei]PPU44207.1 hypothetical protein XdyCFBP7245_23005 [Xanthomonas dyei]
MKRLPASADCRPWYAPTEHIVVNAAPDISEEQSVLEHARAMGYQEGLARAHEEAAALAQRELAQLTDTLQAEARSAREITERLHTQMQDLVAGLALAVDEQARRSHEVAVEVAFHAVTQVIGGAYANTPLLTDLCHRAMRDAGHQAVALHVCEQDLALCPKVAGLAIQCDLSLRPGQCILETRAGRTEFGLDVRLSALQAALLDGLSTYQHVAR